MGDEKRPRFRLPARADKGPSGAPTNGLSLLGGVLLAGFRRGHKHGATLGSTSESGKTNEGSGVVVTHIRSSFVSLRLLPNALTPPIPLGSLLGSLLSSLQNSLPLCRSQ